MKSKLLKLLIVLAAFGIVVVVVVLVFKNKDVEKKTYTLIADKHAEVNFNTVYQNSTQVKKAYDGVNDDYAVAVANMIEELERACEYYNLYIPNIDISQEDMDNLLEKYTSYIDAIKVANAKYVEYVSAYESTNEDIAGKNNAILASATSYVVELNKAYQKGSLYYYELKARIADYTKIKSTTFLTISYDSVLCIADSLSTYIVQQMNQRMDPTGTVADITENKNYKNFNSLRSYFNTDNNRSKELASEKLSAFVKNYNKIGDAKPFWLNTNTYISGLEEGTEIKNAAIAMKGFLNEYVSTYEF